MAQKIIGLDLGTDTLRAVVLEAGLRGYAVTAHAVVPLDPPAPASPEAELDPASTAEPANEDARDDRLARAVAELAGRLGGLRADVVAVALPGGQATTPIVTLPFVDQKKIDATLGFEVENLLPFDLDEVIYDYQPVSQREGKTELLVGVARIDEVRALVDTLREAGVDPRVVTLPSLANLALLGELASLGSLPADQAEGLVDFGRERTILSIVRGAAGDRQLPGLVYVRSMGGAGEGRMAAAIRELRQSLFSAQARGRLPLRRLFLVGELAAQEGLAERLSSELGVPVERLASLPGEGAQTIPPELHGPLAQAFGLALRGHARGGRLLNLRKGELAFRGDLDYLKGKVSRLAAFAAVLLLLAGASLWMRIHILTNEEEALDRALCNHTQRVLGSCETDFNVALSKLQGGGTSASKIPTASALEVFAEAASRAPTEISLRIDEVDATLDMVRLRGSVDSFDAVDQVVAELRKSRCIGDVKPGRIQKNREEKIEFTLDALYVCGQNADKAG
ncbi:type IV pilus biogenesis protein PilM [Vulgatibacter incomptus]|uniref:Type IV pilus biogenesis protein PilM n=1 Tax=Vulgatibacter incomptus TaxID=1391653 RepID=A0A0K1PDX8_9BACT|nr:pilus assembly protein PilM [Vulgatibacter incomptus]AKU91329.1 Type IV pilus biogenesis protein PilM [Vulgatibacter incomptus]